MTTQTEPRVYKLCRHCGSADVSTDAVVRWNVDTQEWECSGILDEGDCCDECSHEHISTVPEAEALKLLERRKAALERGYDPDGDDSLRTWLLNEQSND
jgi:hypothetical protein